MHESKPLFTPDYVIGEYAGRVRKPWENDTFSFLLSRATKTVKNSGINPMRFFTEFIMNFATIELSLRALDFDIACINRIDYRNFNL